jgi:hypothetical protein
MSKRILAGFFGLALIAGCAEDKKAQIPSKLDNPLPKVATSGGGGAPKGAAGAGGNSKAD